MKKIKKSSIITIKTKTKTIIPNIKKSIIKINKLKIPSINM